MTNQEFLELCRTSSFSTMYVDGKETKVISKKQLLQLAEAYGIERPAWLYRDEARRAKRGWYRLDMDYTEPAPKEKKARKPRKSNKSKKASVQVSSDSPLHAFGKPVEDNVNVSSKDVYDFSITGNVSVGDLVPDVNPLYVKYGHFKDVKNIISSKIFYPTFITGLSGNGKTEMVDQAAAHAGRDLVRVNITIETDEDDLLGGFRLVNGETKWFDGPVVQAMELGAVLLLDEIDLASSRIMCLQPVLEGKGIFLKKTNRVVRPSAGFNVIATANTKGQGNESGKFVGTGILNEAFLERFAITMEQEYANEKVESQILTKLFESHNLTDETGYIDRLCKFGFAVREAYVNQSIDDIISTRRLVHMINAYAIFKDEDKAFDLCTSRFEESIRIAFKQMWESLRPDPEGEVPVKLEEPEVEDDDLHALFDAAKDINF